MRCLSGAALLAAASLACPPALADEPARPQWMPGMPVPAQQPAAEARRVVSPEGHFALTAPPGWKAAAVLPDAKEFVDRVRLEREGAAVIAEARPGPVDNAPEPFRKFIEEEMKGYQASFKDVTFGPAQEVKVGGHPGWEAVATGNPKGRPWKVHLAIASDGRRRLDVVHQGSPDAVTEATWREVLASVEFLVVRFGAQTFKDELGEFTVVPPPGWLRHRAEGEPAPTAEFRAYGFPSRDGSGGELRVEVVALPQGAGKVPADRLLQSYRGNVIEKRGGKDVAEAARGEAGQGDPRVAYGVWTYTNAEGKERYLIAGGVVARGRIYSLMASGPRAELAAHQPAVLDAFGTFTFTPAAVP